MQVVRCTGCRVARVTNPIEPVSTEREPHFPQDQAQRGGVGAGAATAPAASAKTKDDGQAPWYIEIPAVIVLTLAIMFVIQTFLGRLYVIPSASMEPTLHGENGSGDRILVEKVSYYFNDPKPGDVVVFKGTDSWNTGFYSNRSSNTFVRGMQEVGSWVGLVPKDENTLVKRIIAEGGQTVSCQAGDPAVMVDGKPVDQSYVLTPPTYPVDEATGSEACGGAYFGPVEVPEGNYFMMGDNRTNSADSRYHLGDEYQGTIPRENLRGRVQAVVFPLDRFGNVANPDIQQ